MSIRYLKTFGDLKLKYLISWIVQLFNLIWYKKIELKLKIGLDNWLSILIWLFELTFF